MLFRSMVKAGHIGDMVALHNPKCAMDEDAMLYGMSAMITAALNYLDKKASK